MSFRQRLEDVTARLADLSLPDVHYEAGNSPLESLPTELLKTILEHLEDETASTGPKTRIYTPKDLDTRCTITARNVFRNLCLTSRPMNLVATRYLYKIVCIGTPQALMLFWRGLAVDNPSNGRFTHHLICNVELMDWAIGGVSVTCHTAHTLSFVQAKNLMPLSAGPFAALPQRIFWDIIRRTSNLRTLALPQAISSANHSEILIQFLRIWGPLGISQNQVPSLHSLTRIRMRVATTCVPILEAFGTLVLPMLQRLEVVGDNERWILTLVESSHQGTTISERISRLEIVSPTHESLTHLDGLGDIAKLEFLEIAFPPNSDPISRHIPLSADFSHDLNDTITRFAKTLKTLIIESRLEPTDRAWTLFGPNRHLTCLNELKKLEQVKVPLQLLFGSLAALTDCVSVLADEESDEEDEDEYEDKPSDFDDLLKSLSRTLETITLAEWWPTTEVAPHFELYHDDDHEPVAAMTFHLKGDWMAKRWDDWIAYNDESPDTMIISDESEGLLEVIKRTCRVWMAKRPKKRTLWVLPQLPYFYGNIIHRVVLNAFKNDKLVGEYFLLPSGAEAYGYWFAA